MYIFPICISIAYSIFRVIYVNYLFFLNLSVVQLVAILADIFLLFLFTCIILSVARSQIQLKSDRVITDGEVKLTNAIIAATSIEIRISI